ncbi:tyrosinase precursor like [Lecanosticta acicola]|uniref:tyrosinase n=1 Tax=Lecanosticta acicola TaxID=111012 RepID=A0AAI9EAT6_9PEZI|nr:tyrosinase precursor like [Lecanosticta acicola]
MKLRALVSLLTLASYALAHALDHDAPILEERQSSAIILSGPGDTVVRTRLEIRQMKDNEPDQYTLLVLALEQWMAQPQSSPTSYYGISSIHGVPRQDWDGVTQCASCTGADGYCPHDSVLFPAWHRSFVALFEQEFLMVVKNIANSYPAGDERDRMVNAANVMRWPYWDWAAHPPAGRSTLPKVVSDYTVTVNAPSGPRTLEPNPLFRFDYQDNSGMYYSPFTTWTRTYRYPTSNGRDAISNTQSCINAFENVRQSLQDQIYQLFTSCNDYLQFSNDDATHSSTQCKSSLESIHDTVHVTAGGPGGSVSGGHIGYLMLSAFDPLFWLHHCNVDRLFAMWQTINPNSYGASQQAPHSTWTIAQGSTQDQNSPLKPFRKTSSTFWTTNDVQDWTVFQYTYSEFADSDGSADAISNYINQLYGPNANAAAGSSKRDLADDITANVNGIAADVNGITGNVDGVISNVANGLDGALPENPLRACNGSSYEYYCNIETPRYALNGSYGVFLFSGQPASENPADWIMDQNLIGPLLVLAQDGMTNHNIITSGSIPLTRTLQSIVGTNSGLLAGLTEALVVPYLRENLQWRIAGPGGECVEPSSLPGFVVSVVASTAAPSDDKSKLPVLSEFVSLLDVTQGLGGGMNSTQQRTLPVII